MNIPKIRQLPSGAWTCQIRIDGQSISITDFDRDTVEAKAYAYKAGIIKARRVPKDITVGDAIDNYIESRRAVSSPSTICGYRTIKRTRFLNLQRITISALTRKIMQAEINAEATLCSPKTLKNAYGLIAAAVAYEGGDRFDVALPQVPPANKQFLQPEEIPILTDAVKGSRWEIPILLGLLSCRRSEIYGLRWENIDLNARTITVSGAIVPNEKWELVEKKELKNRQSVRVLPMTDQLYEALSDIPEAARKGHVVSGNPNSLYVAINRICEQNGLPKVGIHGLRHSFASMCYSLGVSEKLCAELGGWETSAVMHDVYTHLAQKDINKSAADIVAFFSTNNIANKNANKTD